MSGFSCRCRVLSLLMLWGLSLSPVFANDKEQRRSMAAASVEPFTIEADWIGAIQWMTGHNFSLETFNGSIGKGIDFQGSSITLDQYVPVQIRFSSDSADWSRVGVFRRDHAYNWDSAGLFPGSAWDISDTANPRRLNLCISEYDDGPGGNPAANRFWDPDTSALGNFEYLYVMNSSYDATGLTYAGIDLNDDDPDILYMWWPRVVPGHTLLETLPAALYIRPIIPLQATDKESHIDLSFLIPGPTPVSIYVFRDTSPNPSTQIATIPGTANLFIDSAVSNNTNYYYLIKSAQTLSGHIALTSHDLLIHDAQRLRVEATSPKAQAINGSQTSVNVEFDNPIVPSSVTNTSFQVYGRRSGIIQGTLQFGNNDKTVIFTANTPMEAGEWITVSVTKSIQSTVPGDTFGGFTYNYWTKTKTAPMQFTEIQQKHMRLFGEDSIGLQSAFGGDFNNDGYPDLALICNVTNDCRLLLNNGHGVYDSFTVYPLSAGIGVTEGADLNRDGWMDLILGTSSGNEVNVLMNTGAGAFSPSVSYPTGNAVYGLVVTDVESDGDQDILTCNVLDDDLALLRNDNSGVLEAPLLFATTLSSSKFTLTAADANEDGFCDLLVVPHIPYVYTMLNDGNGNYGLAYNPYNGMPGDVAAAGDINNDGHVDIVSVGDHSTAHPAFGDGKGGFSNTDAYFPFSIGEPHFVALGDLDGDGDIDGVTSCFSPNEIEISPNNNDDISVPPYVLPIAGASTCVVLQDVDNDGDLDIAALDRTNDVVYVYENKYVCCVGVRGDVNSTGDITILDLTFLVHYLFSGGAAPPCFDEANVNGVGSITIADLTYLVKFLFAAGPFPPACP